MAETKKTGQADSGAQVVAEPDSMGVGVSPAPDPEDRSVPKAETAKQAGVPLPAPYTEVRSPEGEIKTIDVGASKGVDRAPARSHK